MENIQKRIIAELNEQYGITVSQNNLPAALIEINLRFAERFIVVIDEWDAIFRDHPDEQKLQEDYVNMLSDLFKGLNSESFIELAYLTGIFPIKMYDRRSSLINFRDYSILTPAESAPFFGFTGDEVESICGTFNLDLRLTKLWYDGYILNGLHIYNPYSIMELVSTGIYQSYWNKTASIKAVSSCIELNPGGLLDALITLLEDNRVRTINLDAFNANIYNFESRDAVLTYLIHLGYLGYSDGQLFVPNEELRLELMRAVESSKFDEYLKLIKDSRELLRHTRALDGDYVASVIERFHVRHESYTATREYNSEDDLRNLVDVVAGAYLSCIEDYLRPAREFPTGRCFADLVYLPYRHASYDLPALIIELKINDEAPGIIGKIKDGDYPDAVNGFTGEIILVTIFYDKLTKFHKCVIESLDKL